MLKQEVDPLMRDKSRSKQQGSSEQLSPDFIYNAYTGAREIS